MRTIYLISLILILPSKGKSQSDSLAPVDDGFVLFRLGDTISKFREKLTCDYNYKRKEVANLDAPLTCRGYYYLPADKSPVEVGSVKFNLAFLFPDGKRKIRTVVLSKSYTDDDSIKSENVSEFLLLKKYLEGYFKSNGQRQNNQLADPFTSQKKIAWYVGDSCYVITFTEFKKRAPGQKIEATLNLSYFNYRIIIEADPKMVSLSEYR